MEKSLVTQTINGTFGATMSMFFAESIAHMLPWLAVSFAVIVCDLVVGIRKSLLMDEEVRFSSAIRRTMGKMLTYFSFCVMVAMIDVAAHGGGTIDKYACLLVCFVEGTSIVSNILKPKGFDINVIKILALGISKVAKVDKKDIEEIIEKEDENN